MWEGYRQKFPRGQVSNVGGRPDFHGPTRFPPIPIWQDHMPSESYVIRQRVPSALSQIHKRDGVCVDSFPIEPPSNLIGKGFFRGCQRASCSALF